MSIKCVVFDCDGVLVDSVPVKTNAFAKVVADYGPEKQKAFVQFHLQHGGVSRYKKFAWFYETFVGREITDSESEEMGKRFAQICLEELRVCPQIKGALQVLQFLYGKVPLYVCSGAPRKEQESVLKSQGLGHFFTEIMGSPPAKAELLGQIIAKAHVLPLETLMIGDALTDLEAAEKNGTLFYAVGPQLKDCQHPWGEDLTSLIEYLTPLL